MKKPVTKKKTAKRTKKSTRTPKSTKPSAPKRPPHNKNNGFRKDSNYALAFDCLAFYASKKPYSRKDLTEKYALLSKKDFVRAGFDLAVILSPTLQKDGSIKFHRSSERATRIAPFHVIKQNGNVQLVIIKSK